MKILSNKDIMYEGHLSKEDTVYCTTYIETSEIRPSLHQPASRPGPIVPAIERTNALYKCIRSSPCVTEVYRARGRRWKNEAVRKKVPQCETSTCVSSSLHTAVIK